MPTSAASEVRGVSSIGPSLTINATPAMPRTKPAIRRASSGSFSTGTEMSALQSGTMPFITAR